MIFSSFEFLEQDYDYILCLKFDFPLSTYKLDVDRLVNTLESFFQNEQDIFIIITHKDPSSAEYISIGEYIYSFSCRFQHFRNIVATLSPIEKLADNLLYIFLNHITHGRSQIAKILARQIPFEYDLAYTPISCDIVIPHRGRLFHLEKLLPFLGAIKKLNIYIGFDQPESVQNFSLSTNLLNLNCYIFRPGPVGPYVIRNWLIDQGNAPIVFFQDSDDIPCADRFYKLSSYMSHYNVPLCGSHEIQLDDINKTVQAIRYPVNVNIALRDRPINALLHPASAIQREAFYYCGRLSEERIFGNDTKFLYYSYFKLSDIKNINEFLYIRRVHAGSLTTSKDTCYSSAARMQLTNSIVVDFALVKLGMLDLEQSYLKFVRSKCIYEVDKIS